MLDVPDVVNMIDVVNCDWCEQKIDYILNSKILHNDKVVTHRIMQVDQLNNSIIRLVWS